MQNLVSRCLAIKQGKICTYTKKKKNLSMGEQKRTNLGGQKTWLRNCNSVLH